MVCLQLDFIHIVSDGKLSSINMLEAEGETSQHDFFVQKYRLEDI